MIAKALRVVALTLLMPGLAFAQGAQFSGTWKAVVLKKKDERVSLTQDGYSLLIAIDDQKRTWTATARTRGGEKQTAGTFTVDEQHVVFADHTGARHALKLHVNGNQLTITPKSDPGTRLVALRVE